MAALPHKFTGQGNVDGKGKKRRPFGRLRTSKMPAYRRGRPALQMSTEAVGVFFGELVGELVALDEIVEAVADLAAIAHLDFRGGGEVRLAGVPIAAADGFVGAGAELVVGQI